jgi:hypothetical protein
MRRPCSSAVAAIRPSAEPPPITSGLAAASAKLPSLNTSAETQGFKPFPNHLDIKHRTLNNRTAAYTDTNDFAPTSVIIGSMESLHMSEAEVARDLHAVLAKVQQGIEVVIEQDHRPVAVLRAQRRSGRPITEILREAKERNCTVTLDEEFGKDMEDIIDSNQKPWNPPSWD